MGDGLGKPEYDRYDPPPPFHSSDTYYPSGDHLAAYGGRGGLYPGYPSAASPDYLRPGVPGLGQYRSAPPAGPMPSSFNGGNPFGSLSSPPPRGAGLRQGLGSSLSPLSRVSSMDTLIIWDWDDTLMCSTAINTGRLPAGSAPQLEALLEEALLTSLNWGETLIVTNADDLWVYESTRRFAPRVLPLLSQVPILSARRKHEANFPGDVFAWKRETFREILSARNFLHGLNLVVLGDSPAEIEAAQTGSYGLGIHPLLIKTVKFKETPTCEELYEQQRIITQDIGAIVQEEKDSNRNLATRVRSQSFGSYLGGYRGAAASSVPLSPLSSSAGNYAVGPSSYPSYMMYAA